MDKQLIIDINKRFILKCRDSTGQKSLKSAKHIPMFIGVGGEQIASKFFKEALKHKGGNFEQSLRGIVIRFNRRKPKQ